MKLSQKIWFGVFFLLVNGFLSYFVITPNDELVKEDTKYIYVKEYSWWGYNYSINQYHKSILYDGIISEVNIYPHMVGMIGKGGHWQTETSIKISFNGKTYNDNKTNYGMTSNYMDYKKGDKVKVIEYFYPRHYIEYEKY